MKKKNKLEGKFVICFDTIVDGEQCYKDDKDKPVLYNSYEEAFTELFDDALSMLLGRDSKELKECNEGVTKKMVKEMEKVFDSGDVKAMETFLNKNPNCNDNNEWVAKADEFLENRKLIFGSTGFKVTGKKL